MGPLQADLAVDDGVFSPDRLDAGTAVLSQIAPPPGDGDGPIVDVGCGYGPITAWCATTAASETIYGVDVNERALALAGQNVARFGDRVHICAPDAVPTDLRFGRMYSNPPIRIGKAANRELIEHWLDRLTPDGRGYLVINKNLGGDSYARWMDSIGFGVTRLGSRQGYRVLEVVPRTV